METASAAAVAAHVQRATNELVAAAALVPHCGQEDEAALSKVVGALGQAEAAAQVGLLKEGMRAAPKHSRTPWRRAAAPVPPPPPPCLQAVHCALRCLQQKQAGRGMRPLASLQVGVA